MNRISVGSDTVRTICQAFLDNREKRIQKEREKLIEEEMKERKVWMGLRKVGPFTRDEAIERLKNEEEDSWGYNRWYALDLEGRAWKYRAQNLIAASYFADIIWLDDDDVRLLRGFKD